MVVSVYMVVRNSFVSILVKVHTVKVFDSRFFLLIFNIVILYLEVREGIVSEFDLEGLSSKVSRN